MKVSTLPAKTGRRTKAIIIILAFILRLISIDSKAQSNLARPVMIQIPTQSPGRYTAELP